MGDSCVEKLVGAGEKMEPLFTSLFWEEREPCISPLHDFAWLRSGIGIKFGELV